MNSRNRLLRNFLLRLYIDLPNFVDHLTRKPYAYTTRCKCKITRFNLASRETGIKRFRAWTHRWVRFQHIGVGGWRTPGTNVLEKSPERVPQKRVNGTGGTRNAHLLISIIAPGKLGCGSSAPGIFTGIYQFVSISGAVVPSLLSALALAIFLSRAKDR